MKSNTKKSLSSISNVQTLSKENLLTISGGNLPAGWTKTTMPNGDIRYDGPNGSYMIVHAR